MVFYVTRLLCVSFFSGLLWSCSPPPASEAGSPSEAAVQEQRWQAAGIADYRYDFQQECFCVREQVQPVTIEVRGGEMRRVMTRETGEDLATLPNLQWPTIDGLFSTIAEAEEQGRQPLTVEYDPELGYPTRIEIGSLAADAGVIYTASDLQPLP